MKATNGHRVYKKLRTLYGNSFNSMIGHHSSHLFVVDKIDRGLGTVEATELNNEEILDLKADIPYLTDGYMHCEDCISPSQKGQRQIELLAQKVTKSIIGARGLDK